MRVVMFQWAAGAFCAVVGALMLIAPHQFGAPALQAIQPHLSWWGWLFTLVGTALFGTAALMPGHRRAWLTHVVAGIAFLVLAWGFVSSLAWSGAVVYGVLGLGMLLAPLVARRVTGGGDFFSLVVGVAAALLGLVILAVPSGFGSVIYGDILPTLVWHGVAFGLGGLALVASQLFPAAPRWFVWSARLWVALAFWLWMFLLAIPTRTWTGVAFYGGFGALLVLQPWLDRHLERLSPTSLRTRLALALAVAVALPLIVAMTLVTSQQARMAKTQALRTQELLAKALAQDVADYINLHRAAVSALAAQPDLLTLSAQAQEQVLAAVNASYHDAYVFATVDAAGNIIARSTEGPLGNISGLQLFRDVRELGQPSLELLFSPVTNLRLFSFGAPVYDDVGQFRGMVTSALTSARLTQLLADVSGGGDTVAYLVDENGRVIAHPDEALIRELTDLSTSPPVDAFLRTDGGIGSLDYREDAGTQLAGFAKVPDLGWGVVVERPRAAALAPVRSGRELVFGLLLLGIGVAVFIGVLAARRLAAPLSHLAHAARTLQAGDKTVSLPESEIDEIAHLAGAFGQLREHLSERTAQRDRIEAYLRQERDFSNMVINSLPGIFYLFDSHGRMLRWNRRLEQVTDYRSEEVAKLHPLDVFDASDKAMVAVAIQEVFEQGQSSIEADLVSKHGAHVPYFFIGSRLFLDGEAYVVGTGVDIRERKEAEEALRESEEALRRLNAGLEQRVRERTAELESLNQELEAFNYSVAHDLRAPLRGIDGFSQALLEDYGESLDRTGREYLARIGAGAQRMGRLIDDLLNLSRLSRRELTLNTVDLSQVAREVAAELGRLEPAHRVRVDIADGVSVLGDERLLTIVLENLLGNAWKFTREQDHACLEFGLRQEPEREVYFVRDNGAGFDMAYAGKLFKAFQRLHTQGQFEGTGIGLATVERIVHRHGGEIWAESAPGKGATFFFTLVAG